MLAYLSGMTFNFHHGPSGPLSGTTLSCQHCQQPQNPLTGTLLNCNLTQTLHDMPSGHVGHLGHLRHLEQLRHPSHLGHLSHLSNIGDLNSLDLSPLDPTPTDSLPGAFITEMDPTDPGPSEGCYADDSLDPIHTEPLLETNMQDRLPLGVRHTSQIDRQVLSTLDFPIDALDGHSSFLEIPR
jgi:hypothetical protein